MAKFVRFQSAVPNRHGDHPGVFAMVMGLAKAARLSPEDASWLRQANELATAAYVDPSTVTPDCYDPIANPGARSWFKGDQDGLLNMVQSYLHLLDRYEIAWMELRTSRPGRITYEDAVQVVAVPHTFPNDWPFR